MSARDVIDLAIHRGAIDGLSVSQTADAVIDAIRAMAATDQADLIGGRVEYHAGSPVLFQVVGPTQQVHR
jgi:hypothetical protein